MKSFDWGKARVLIVDHDEDFRLWIRGVLLDAGAWAVQTYSDAQKALTAASGFKPDVVLIEVNLKGMPGVEMARKLRDPHISVMPKVPIILTGYKANARDLDRAVDIGIEGLLVKPAEADTVLRRLAQVIRNPRRIVRGKAYIGPDRRNGVSEDFSGPWRRKFDPPHLRQAGPVPAPKPVAKEPPPAPKIAAKPVAKAVPEPKIAAKPVAKEAPPPPKIAAKPVVKEAPSVLLSSAASKLSGGKLVEDEAPAAKAEPPKSVPLEPAKTAAPAVAKAGALEVAAQPAKGKPKHSADAWKDALGGDDAEAEPAKEPALDVVSVLEAHALWLATDGREGERAVLAGADLSGTDLKAARLVRADLSKANLSQAICDGADFAGANMREVDLSLARCVGANFEGADIRYGELTGADMTESRLAVASLRHANLRNGVFKDTNFRGADLAGVRMAGALLDGADISGAILLETNVCGADLSKAVGMKQQQVDRLRLDGQTRLPPGIRRPQAAE